MSTATKENIVYVDPVVLERVEARLLEVYEKSKALGLLLVDSSGVVLAAAGETPLHPAQMGALAAGVYGAARVLVKASGASEFFITVPLNGTSLSFRRVDARVFLCAFHAEADGEEVRNALAEIARDSQHSMEGQPQRPHVGNTSFIEEKLNEIFGR